MNCVHKSIESSLDRFSEAHWQIHQIEQHYHSPEGARFSFNAFIRAIKEIPQILLMELQNRSDYSTIIKPKIETLKENSLFFLLSKKRDYVVHKGMLDVHSSGTIGTTEGRGFKIGFSFAVAAWETSDEAYSRFIKVCRSDTFLRELMGPDCDSWPILQRKWCLPDFPDQDFLSVAVTAWETCGTVISEILVHLGGEPLDTTLLCAPDPDKVRRKEYSQADFFRLVDGFDIGKCGRSDGN